VSDFHTLCDDIKSSMSLTTLEGSGFYSCYCPICKKHENKTAGVRFEEDQIILNCFRASCDATCVFTHGQPISRKFRAFVDAIGVKISPSLSMVKNPLQKKIEEALNHDLYEKHYYKDMNIPKGWVPLDDTDVSKWIHYYHDRHCPIDDVYYIKTGMYQGSTAIVMRYHDKVIGFQIASTDGLVKYRTVSDNTHIMMINGGLLSDPVILVEGVLDALCFPHACGVLKSTVSPEQAYILRNRDVVVLPDRTGSGFVDQAFQYGWKVSIPKWKCKDLNEAVIKYGQLGVARLIHEGVYSNRLEGLARYRLWTKKDIFN